MARATPHVWAARRAERLIGEWGIEALPIDVEAIARQHGIQVQSMPQTIRGVSGMLQRAGEVYGIAYATYADNHGFERFSIAHELGHYFLDGHSEKVLGAGGVHQSRGGFASGDKYELEADHFAAGLLMPTPLFERAMDKAGKGFTAVEHLAELCETSLTATAIRYAEATDDAVAVVVSSGSTIDYWFASDTLKFTPGVEWLKKGEPVPRGTATERFNKDSDRVSRCEREQSSSNVLDWFGDGPDRELSEDVVGLGSYGRTLTVLFAEESWPDEEDEEDEHLGDFEPKFHRSRRR